MTCRSCASSESEALGSAGSRTSPCRWAVPFRMVMHVAHSLAIPTARRAHSRNPQSELPQMSLRENRRQTRTGTAEPLALASSGEGATAVNGDRGTCYEPKFNMR